MKVGGSPIQTLVNSTLQNRDAQRQQVQQPVRELEKASQKDRQAAAYDQDVQLSDAARRAFQQRPVAAAAKPADSQRNYQYYPFPDRSALSASQQKALQTYSSNQDLSRTSDSKGEFLGSVDVFA